MDTTSSLYLLPASPASPLSSDNPKYEIYVKRTVEILFLESFEETRGK